MARIIQSTGRLFSTQPVKSIKIPPRIERGPTDVLRALAATVGRDPTAPHYKFVDDPALEPLSYAAKRTYALSKEQGRRAARYFLVNYPQLFYRDDAEPKIPAFNPPDKITPGVDCVEEDIIISIQGCQVANAIQCYKNCIEKKVPVSPETQLMLLELCCFSNSNDLEYEWIEERWYLNTTKDRKNAWLEDSFAETLFKTLGESEATLNAMICGHAKHGSHERAYSLYEQAKLLQFTISLSSYNLLILTVPAVSHSGDGRWERIVEILEHMKRNKVQPNVLTFTNILDVLSKTSIWRDCQSMTLKVLKEMDALKLTPCLACYMFLTSIFTESRSAPPQPEILYSVVDAVTKQVKALKGKPESNGKLAVVHPKDGLFFVNAMKLINNMLHDLELAMNVHEILVANPHLMDSSQSESFYYREFFILLTKTASLDQLMAVYDELVPHTFVPDSALYSQILNSVFMYDQLHLIPRLWTDIVFYNTSYNIQLARHLVENLVSKPVPQLILEQINATIEDILSRTEEMEEKTAEADLLRSLVLRYYVTNDLLDKFEGLLTKLSEEDAIVEAEVIEKFCTLALEKANFGKVAFGLKMARLFSSEGAIRVVRESLDSIPKDDANYENIKQLVT